MQAGLAKLENGRLVRQAALEGWGRSGHTSPKSADDCVVISLWSTQPARASRGAQRAVVEPV